MPIPAVILAAGRATRLRPFTDHLPKSLLPVAGTAMLERSLRHLIAAQVREVVIVTGFQRAKLEETVLGWDLPITTVFVNNPDFETTNNAYSLMLAEEAIGGRPFVLLDSDLVYDAAILPELLGNHGSCLALRPAPDLGLEEVKVSMCVNGRVTGIGKEVGLDVAAGESVGIEVFSGRDSRHLFATLKKRIIGQNLVNEYYEASFQQMIEEGASMHAIDIAPHRAMEVDTPADLTHAEHVFGAVTTPAPLPRVAARLGHDRPS